MTSVDTKTLVHAGVEIVIIGGIAFWLNTRISGLQEELTVLRQKVESLEGVIQQQNQLLSRHEAILRQITGGGPPPQSHQGPPPQSYHPQSDRQEPPPPSQGYHPQGPQEERSQKPQGGRSQRHQEGRQRPQGGRSQRPHPPSESHTRKRQSSFDEGPQELSPDELDKFLESELSSIHEARDQCEGDQCVLKTKRPRKKGRRRKKSHGD